MNFNSHIEVPNLTAAARIIEQKGAEQKGKEKKNYVQFYIPNTTS
jgi:hypothetical protein